MMKVFRRLSASIVLPLCRWVAVACLLAAIFFGTSFAYATDFVFETPSIRYVVDSTGQSKSLQVKEDGRELLVGPAFPFASLRKGGRYYPVTSLRRTGKLFRVEFGSANVVADYRIIEDRGNLIIELSRVAGKDIEELRLLQLRIGGMINTGEQLAVQWDDQFAVSLMGLDDRVNTRFEEGMLLSSVYPEFGMAGEKVVLVAVQTQRFLDGVERIERRYHLPSPRIHGIWAKKSPDVRSSYLFTDMNEANADETIRYAKLAHFKYILIYSHTWASSLGSYPINTQSFPRGEVSLKAVINKCHAAGLKVGMHMLTSLIGKNDPFVRPRADHRLLSDAEAVLASDIDEKNNEIPTTGYLTHFRGEWEYGVSRDVRIDDEVIHYETIGGPNGSRLVMCTRGYAGTIPDFHHAGAKIYHLAEYGGAYVADLKTTIKGEISARIADLINRCGFDMIYFDGGEVNCLNGPCWYWAGQQQVDIWSRVKRDLLVQGSGMTKWLWHLFARGNCDDFVDVAPKQYLNAHKIADAWIPNSRSFLPSELGWWGILSSEPDHPATTPDEVEYYAVRMLAFDTPVSLETSLAALKANGRTDEMLELLGSYEELRLRKMVPSAIRDKLRTGEWHRVKDRDLIEFRPAVYDSQRLDRSGEAIVKNMFSPQKFHFRLQAVPTLSSVGDRSNITLLASKSPPVLLSPLRSSIATLGALGGRIAFTRAALGMAAASSGAGYGVFPIDLSKHRALAVKLIVEGPMPKQNEPGAVLNVQLETSGKQYRDYYIDLNFAGEKLIIIPEPNAERMLPEFRPVAATYSFKAALQGFDYRDIVALNFRWMRQPFAKPVTCKITLVEALAENESVIKDPEVTVGATSITMPITLKTGDYLEAFDDGLAKVFDRNGVQLSTVEMPDLPVLAPGENRIFFHNVDPSAVKLTTMLLGKALPH